MASAFSAVYHVLSSIVTHQSEVAGKYCMLAEETDCWVGLDKSDSWSEG